MTTAAAVLELERVVRFAQAAAGLVPEWAARPLMVHELAARVNFAALDRIMQDGYDATEAAVAQAVDALTTSLTKSISGAAPQQAAAKVTTWAGKLPPVVVDQLDTITRELAGKYAAAAAAAAAQVTAEAAAQGLPAQPGKAPAPGGYLSQAESVVQMAKQQVVAAALARSQGGHNADEVIAGVKATNTKAAVDLGRQAVHQASAAGRSDRAADMPLLPKEIYASELLDKSTCDRCSEIDGKVYATLQEAEVDYPTGPYRHCRGRLRCRGTLVFIWPSESDPGGAARYQPPPTPPPTPAPPKPPPPPPPPPPAPVPEVPVVAKPVKRQLHGSFAPKPQPVGKVTQLTGSFAPKPPPPVVPPSEPPPLPATGPKWKLDKNGKIVPNTPPPAAAVPPVVEPVKPAPAAKPASKPAPKPAAKPAAKPKPAAADVPPDTVRGFRSQREGKAWAAKVWPGAEGFNHAEMAGIKSYTGSGYHQTNGALRSSGGKRGANKGLDAAMNKVPRVPEPIRVGRGTTAQQFGLPWGSDLSALTGKEFTEHGYLSTSVAARGAFSDKEVDLRLVVPRGHRALYVSGAPTPPPYAISAVGGGEAELILMRGTRFRVTQVRRVKGKWRVDAEVIPDDA